MKTHVSFEFPSSTLTQDEPPYGRDIAEPLVAHLRQCGFGDIGLDELDYAYTFHATVGKRRFYVLVGLVDDGDRQWLISTNSTLGFFSRLLGAKDDREHSQLVNAVHEFLRTVPQFKSIRWYTEDEWNTSPDESWADNPMS